MNPICFNDCRLAGGNVETDGGRSMCLGGTYSGEEAEFLGRLAVVADY